MRTKNLPGFPTAHVMRTRNAPRFSPYLARILVGAQQHTPPRGLLLKGKERLMDRVERLILLAANPRSYFEFISETTQEDVSDDFVSSFDEHSKLQ